MKKLCGLILNVNQKPAGATTNRREDPGRFTRKVEGGGASGLISPLLDHII